MPNHWKTRIIFKKKADVLKVQEIFTKEQEQSKNWAGEMTTTFIYRLCNDVMPRPELLDHTQSPSNGMYKINPEKYEDKENKRPFTKEELVELAKIGYDNWYDWSCKHWGTKWDIYGIKLIAKGVEFESAWCPPIEKVFELFAKKYGFTSFEVVGHDEGERGFKPVYSIKIKE